MHVSITNNNLLVAIEDCGQIPAGVNTASVTGVILNYPSSYVYTCNANHVSNTSMVIVCQADGTLSMDSGPTCYPMGRYYIEYNSARY